MVVLRGWICVEQDSCTAGQLIKLFVDYRDTASDHAVSPFCRTQRLRSPRPSSIAAHALSGSGGLSHVQQRSFHVEAI
jgi:hypothetical protein